MSFVKMNAQKTIDYMLDKDLELKRMWDESTKIKCKDELEDIRQRRLAALGCMNGEIWMADDFDEPLDVMDASISSTDFWDNEVDDKIWNSQ